MEQPLKPGTNPVELRNCIEELVSFNGTLECDIGLSKQFCSSLLNHNSTQPIVGSSKCDKLASFWKGSDLNQKEDWFDLVHKKGSELVEILKSINFELHVQEPFFTQTKRIASRALILFNKYLVLEVQEVYHYASFFEMLEAESRAKVLPGVKTIDEGIQVYRKFYSEEKEMSNGVLAICIAKIAAQPYLSLARILSGLRYEAVLSLLNQGQLIGSFP